MFVICFISQWMKRSKRGLFVFPPKRTLIWRTHRSTGQSCSSVTSKRSNGWFLESSQAWSFLPERSFNQTKATHVCIRSINQSNRSIAVRLLFLFCTRVFISRSYENRSIRRWISILYNNVEFGVMNAGFMTNYFKVSRGVRQGCPLSPLLFVCYPLIVRQNQLSRRMELPKGQNAKISYVANDTTLILVKTRALRNANSEFI